MLSIVWSRLEKRPDPLWHRGRGEGEGAVDPDRICSGLITNFQKRSETIWQSNRILNRIPASRRLLEQPPVAPGPCRESRNPGIESGLATPGDASAVSLLLRAHEGQATTRKRSQTFRNVVIDNKNK